MIRYKKQVAFLFGAIAMVTYLGIRFFPQTTPEAESVITVQGEEEHLQIFLLDSEKTLVPLSVPVSNEMSEEDRIQLMVSYMSGKQKIENFQPLFTKECKATSVQIQKGIATLNFDNSLKNYKPENELRVLEALVWGATQFHDIEQVKLNMNGVALKQMPIANTPIPDVLNRGIGINHFETSTTALHKSSSITVFGTKNIAGKQYLVPRSKRFLAEKDSVKSGVEQIVKDLSVSSNVKQPIYTNQVDIKNVSFKSGTLVVDLNSAIIGTDKSVKKDVYHSLVLSLSVMADVKKVQVKVNGVPISLNKEPEAVAVTNLIYNEVMF